MIKNCKVRSSVTMCILNIVGGLMSMVNIMNVDGCF